ncbi:MAG TPA: hypothetical protein VLK84_19960, partial [Longimicrobium sp.]|nr:hypothetical protein [Longimicrobium sp.]
GLAGEASVSAVDMLVDAWWALLAWWPFPPLGSAALLLGTLLLAQALSLVWERRELLRMLSPLERRAGVILLLLWVVLIALWAADDQGLAWTATLGGAYARWFVGQAVRLGDAGLLGVSEDEDDEDDENG